MNIEKLGNEETVWMILFTSIFLSIVIFLLLRSFFGYLVSYIYTYSLDLVIE